MAEKHLNKISTSLVMREMQIKTTLRFHLIPIRMAKMKNSGDSRKLSQNKKIKTGWRHSSLIENFLVKPPLLQKVKVKKEYNQLSNYFKTRDFCSYSTEKCVHMTHYKNKVTILLALILNCNKIKYSPISQWRNTLC